MRKVFSNSTLDDTLAEKGWVKVSLLNETEVDSLIRFYKERESFQKQPGLHFSLASNNYGFRKEVNEAIAEVLSSKAEALFNNYRMLYANFMIKEPGAEGNFPLHQDWTYVNEEEFRSVAIWIALTDNNEQTGCLHVVEQSHLWGNAYRGPGLSWKFENVTESLRKNLLPLPLKAGEALVWDHRLIHASNPNTAAYARLAATAILVPQEATAFHFVKEFVPQESVCRYEVDTDFFLRYTMQNLKELNVTLAVKYPERHQPYTDSDLQLLTNQAAV